MTSGYGATVVDPLTLGITVVAGAVALALGWSELPRPPALDGERWFKVALATLLRGRMDAAKATPDEWEATVLAAVPYHPAGRLPERKISNPVAAQLPGVALEGELALVEALAKRTEPAQRWTWMYDEDPLGIDARLADPADLGADYAFGRLGPDASWDTLATWDPKFAAAAQRGLTWVLLDGRPERRVGPPVLDALQAELGATRIAQVDPAGLKALVVDPTTRLAVIAEGTAVTDLLRILVDDSALRDQSRRWCRSAG